MSPALNIELVVSTWPFRTGVVIYEPVTARRVAEFDLDELAASGTQVLRSHAHLLNPLLPYRRRAAGLLAELASDQEFLRDLLGFEGSDPIELTLSDDVSRALSRFAAAHELALSDFGLGRLDDLLAAVEARDATDHHRFVCDWWEQFERPRDLEGPSAFRAQTGPDGGSLYLGMTGGDVDAAVRAWRSDIAEVPLNEFSLWNALRQHWAWRLELSEHAERPVFPVAEQLARIFPSARRLRSRQS